MLKSAIFTLGIASLQEAGISSRPFPRPALWNTGLDLLVSERRGNRVKEAHGEKMAAEMVKAATSDKLKEMDWAKNIEICELVAQDPGYACHSPLSVPFLPLFFPFRNHGLPSSIGTLLVEGCDDEFDIVLSYYCHFF